MSKAKPSANGPGAQLVSTRLRYQMGDANVRDRYLFTPKADKGLKLQYELADVAEGKLAFSEAALTSAAAFVVFNQGSPVVYVNGLPEKPPRTLAAHLPPFLLSRATLAALKAGSQADLMPEWFDERDSLRLKARKQRKVKLDGASTSVPVLHCRGKNIELWVVDDDVWPVILERKEGEDGFYFWKFLEAGKKLKADEDEEF
ncbi:MAG: hypothetical protein JNM56_21995 [Planctomycetia bacterium]|nr:hypothetical protein [Planctomycetia bacterium]